MSVTSWHVSPQRAAVSSSDPSTGEVRVPVALYDLDELQAEVPLVLSRAEAEALRAKLTDLLAFPAGVSRLPVGAFE
ncbi:hypothetical protein ACIA74_25365 [Streptomyces sp. NPDC051658]|uniref:hypothetical protein n=1 Tax=Streptomyces sp. NPDC051658 TaxID=3365667 RepID=UPI0037AE9E9C